MKHANSISDCHHGFVGGMNTPLHKLHTGGSGTVTFNGNICHRSSMNYDNPIVNWSYGSGPGSDGLVCTG